MNTKEKKALKERIAKVVGLSVELAQAEAFQHIDDVALLDRKLRKAKVRMNDFLDAISYASPMRKAANV